MNLCGCREVVSGRWSHWSVPPGLWAQHDLYLCALTRPASAGQCVEFRQEWHDVESEVISLRNCIMDVRAAKTIW